MGSALDSIMKKVKNYFQFLMMQNRLDDKYGFSNNIAFNVLKSKHILLD